MRLIDADEFAKHLYEHIRNDNLRIYSEVCNYLKDFPEVEAEPVRHGRWELTTTYNPSDSIRCSNCGIVLSLCSVDMKGISYYKTYCPKCGAKNVGRKNDESALLI